MESKSFFADNISGSTTKFGNNHPLVIMNACQTGQQGISLTGIGGWAKTFLQAKAFGFIGTLWSIGDETAMKFSKSLYMSLNKKTPLDKAVKEARLAARNPGDVSWLSYTLYAPPNTVIALGKKI